MRPTRGRREERGSQLLELALVTPLLILMLLITIEAAQMARIHQVISNAAREGARVSVTDNYKGKNSDVVNQVITYAATNNVTLTSSNVTVDQAMVIPTDTGVNMSASRVSVSYTYNTTYLKAFSWFGMPTSFTLQTAAQFRNFY